MTWRDVRAGLLLVVVTIYGLAALPLAYKADRKAYDRPFARDEFKRWGALLAAVGIETTHEQLADLAFAGTELSVGARKRLIKPWSPLFKITGTGQAWGLFTYPDRFPARLVVEARPKGGEWRRLYASLDPEATFLRDALVYRRVRGVYDGQSEKAGESWDRFVSFVAGRTFEAYPDVDEVKVKFVGIRTYEPGESATVFEERGEKAVRLRWRP